MVAAYRDLGISRLIGMIRGSAESNEALAAWAEDCRAGERLWTNWSKSALKNSGVPLFADEPSHGRRAPVACSPRLAVCYLLPDVVLAHQMNERYEAPLPLVAYVAGAALAVAMCFRVRHGAQRADIVEPGRGSADRPCPPPAALVALSVAGAGLIAWLWIVAQTFFGGNGDGDVAAMFLWIYGWVGVALISAPRRPRLDLAQSVRDHPRAFGARSPVGSAFTAVRPPTTRRDSAAGRR